jgi:hypothetical protein
LALTGIWVCERPNYQDHAAIPVNFRLQPFADPPGRANLRIDGSRRCYDWQAICPERERAEATLEQEPAEAMNTPSVVVINPQSESGRTPHGIISTDRPARRGRGYRHQRSGSDSCPSGDDTKANEPRARRSLSRGVDRGGQCGHGLGGPASEHCCFRLERRDTGRERGENLSCGTSGCNGAPPAR